MKKYLSMELLTYIEDGLSEDEADELMLDVLNFISTQVDGITTGPYRLMSEGEHDEY